MAAKRLKLCDVRELFRLVGEVRELGADPQKWRPHMTQRLLEVLDAEIVVSSEVHCRCGSSAERVRVIDNGWGCERDGQPWSIHTDREDEVPETFLLGIMKDVDRNKFAHGDVLPIRPLKRMYAGNSFILSQYPLPHLGAVDQLGVHRAATRDLFNTVDHKLVRLFHIELGRLWTRDALQRAKDPTQDLPPRLQQTLAALQLGASEKEVSAQLGISRHTVHNYVKSLHQRLGVSSRGELLAKFSKSGDFVPRLSV
jgi:DNA-binding CsgD family transcriptional regulator